jgi:hypothetical protein
MKTMSGMRVAVALLSAALGLALLGQAEKAMAAGQQEQLDSVQLEKHAAEMATVVQLDNRVEDGQSAQQKVTLDLVAADAQVVKGKPYSAETSTETVQTLTDGNRIVHRTVSKFYRDSEGRTRHEQTFGNVDPDHPSPHEVKVFVDDPVSGTAYVLDPGSKTAEKVVRTRKFLDERTSDDSGAQFIFKTVKDGEVAELGAPERTMIKIRDEHSGNPDAMVLQIPDEKREEVKEDLGTKNIEGVDCTGTRRTITIPAGEVGNEKPISIMTETWFAPAIGAVVQSSTDDPRYGKTTYQLTNVQLGEPAQSLFEPPADFKVEVRK